MGKHHTYQSRNEEMRFDPGCFFKGIEYLGEFVSMRQIYYVYKKNNDFMLVTLSRNRLDSFNVNFIPKRCIEYVSTNFSNRVVDRKTIEEKQTSMFGNSRERSFKILNALYVLCVLGMAKKVEGSEFGAMKFMIMKKV